MLFNNRVIFSTLVYHQIIQNIGCYKNIASLSSSSSSSSSLFNILSMIAWVGWCLLASWKHLSIHHALVRILSWGGGVINHSAQLDPMFSMVLLFLWYPQSPGFCTYQPNCRYASFPWGQATWGTFAAWP